MCMRACSTVLRSSRSDQLVRSLFAKAGLRVAFWEKQKDWPKELFQVYMYALVKDDTIQEDDVGTSSAANE